MNGKEIRLLWLYAVEVWPSFPIPENERRQNVKETAWLDALGDLDAEAVRAAMVGLGDREFPPTPIMLRREAQALLLREAGDPEAPDAEEAWLEVARAVRAVGHYGAPSWSHPAVTATVEAMGWQRICGSDKPEVVHGQFVRAYPSMLRRSEAARPLPPLVAERLARAQGRVLKRAPAAEVGR